MRCMPAQRSIKGLVGLLGVAIVAVAVTVYAAIPTIWRVEGQSDFLAGESEGLSVDSDGTVTLAPRTDQLYDATEPFLWEIAADQAGNLFLGSGNDGKILKVDSSGDSSIFADTNELQIHALATDAQNNVYAGSSPQGRVYRFTPDGDQEILFDPDDRYIWAIAVGTDGNLFVATGDKAQIHRVGPSGQSEILFTSEETHIVSLLLDSDGALYAGTEPNGLVYRIEPNGSGSVVYDSAFQEVRALVKDSKGSLYAATLNGGASPAPRPTATPAPSRADSSTTSSSTPSGDSVTVTATVTAVGGASSTLGSSTSTASAKGAVYRIDPDGTAIELWTSRTDMPMSLAMERDDRLILGTGNDGHVFLIRQDKTSSLLFTLEEDQVTGIIRAGDTAHVVTSNPARLYRIASERSTEGIFKSKPKDTKTLSAWGRIRWEARTPSGTSVKLQTRVGNSEKPDQTWTDWSAPYSLANGEQISSSKGRFLQWRAVLSSSGASSPELHSVTTVYLPQNLAPEVTAITIHEPGQTFQRPLTTNGPLDILGMDHLLPNGNIGQDSKASASPSLTAGFARPFYRKSYQTVSWTASDPNNDELRYDVLYRADGETLWRAMRSDLDQAVVAWDTVSMPDGRYELKVVAKDGTDNPKHLARSGEKISRTLEIDNTPPTISGLTAAAIGTGFRARFQSEDSASPIHEAEYAINSGEWSVIYPVDGIPDSLEESFDFEIEGYQNGVFTLVVKISDSLANTATAQVELR